jgi:imidazolonepropionase-like amidohydrolase
MRVPFGEGSVVWNSDERLSPDEALRAHTIDAAAAMHEEISVGEIKEGFLGDVTVWDGDVHAYLLGNATKPKLVMTIVGGVLMYDATNPA